MRKGQHKRSGPQRTAQPKGSTQPEIDLDEFGQDIVALTVLLLKRRNYCSEQIQQAVESALASTPPWVGQLKGAAVGPDNFAGEVLTRWYLLPRYCRNGEPRPLPMVGRLSFSSLVRSINRRADPEAILQQLVNAGAVRREAECWIPAERALSLRNDPRALALHHIKVIRSALKTVEGNIRRREDLRRFEFSTFADVPRDSYPDLTQVHRELGLNFLQAIDQLFLRYSENLHTAEDTLGVGVSLVFSDDRPLPPLTPPDDGTVDRNSTK